MGTTNLPPGFRFHPTDVELVKYHLKRKVMGKKPLVESIAEVNIYKHAPWDLPDMSCLRSRDLKWYFFCPREKKYGSGARLNRGNEFGFWKTTGKDRPIMYKNNVAGMIKTLVFHRGRAPRGDRTDWVMHEYRLEDKDLADRGIVLDCYVLCKIFQKDGPGPRNGAQYGAPFNEEEWSDEEEPNNTGSSMLALPSTETISMISIAGMCSGALSESGPSETVLTTEGPSETMLTTAGPSETVLTDAGPSETVLTTDDMFPPVPDNNSFQLPEVDDLPQMLAPFTEDEAFISYKNNKTEMVENVVDEAVVESSPTNNLFKDLGDLGKFAEPGKQQSIFNIGYDFTVDYLELDDLAPSQTHFIESVGSSSSSSLYTNYPTFADPSLFSPW